MLAKKFKLPLRRFLAEKQKRHFDSPLFAVFIRENRLGYNRVGVTIANKAEKKAVRRNALRRIMFRHAGEWPRKSLDIHFIAKSQLSKASPADIKKELDRFIVSAS